MHSRIRASGCQSFVRCAAWVRRLPDAVRLAKAYVTESIRGGFPVGHGAGPTDHFFYLRRNDLAAWVRRLRLEGHGRSRGCPEGRRTSGEDGYK